MRLRQIVEPLQAEHLQKTRRRGVGDFLRLGVGCRHDLDQAAADAVRRWKFKPGTLNGQPVDVIFNLTVNFKLN